MILPYEINPYHGAQIDAAAWEGTPGAFLDALALTLTELRFRELQLAWLLLPPGQALLIESAVRLGFSYHHADEAGLQLVLKLGPAAQLPGYATHYIGAGGVVLNDLNELLVIQERYHTRRHFKLPGGTLDPGEHIAAGVVREVFEETGIRTDFISLNCFRHWHGYRYGKSDIYFVCRLRPLTSEITIDPAEIAQALWMPVEAYLNHPDTHLFNRKIVRTVLEDRGLRIDEIPGYGTRESHEMLF